MSLRRVTGDPLGIRLQVAGNPDRFVRFGVYNLLWTKDDRSRDRVLGRAGPEEEGIRWKRAGASYVGTKPFGSRLVLRWVGRPSKRLTPQFERLERVVQAAIEGKSSSLPEGERPCAASGLDPSREGSGECSLKGIPVSFTGGDETLSTPALETRVLGIDTTGELRFPGLPPFVAKGRFAIVAYRVRNESEHPVRFLHPQLRVGRRLVPENPDTAFLLPRSRSLPLPPGATIEARAAFDLDESVDPRKGALVLPAQRDGRAEPSIDLAQGWIRLKDAPEGLPRPRGGKRGSS